MSFRKVNLPLIFLSSCLRLVSFICFSLTAMIGRWKLLVLQLLFYPLLTTNFFNKLSSLVLPTAVQPFSNLLWPYLCSQRYISRSNCPPFLSSLFLTWLSSFPTALSVVYNVLLLLFFWSITYTSVLTWAISSPFVWLSPSHRKRTFRKTVELLDCRI